MESTKEQIGKGILFNPFKIEDKHYFGSFFNLADNNINEVLDELRTRFKLNIEDKKPQRILEQIFSNNISLVEYEKWVKAFTFYFPIAGFLDRTTDKSGNLFSRVHRISAFRDRFISLLNAIDSLRNFYTHFYHEEITIEDEVFEFLDDVLYKTILSVKKKYLKTDNTKELLSKSLQEELDKLYKLKIEFLENKKAEIDKEIAEQKARREKPRKAFRFGKGRSEIINSLYNDAFKYYLFEGKDEKSHLKDWVATRLNDTNKPKAEFEFELPISKSGIVFLLSLFLKRKEIEDLKSNIEGFKGKVIKEESSLKKNSLLFMATHRIYSVHAYKGLKNKIRTSQHGDKETLLMQMLDEISKVPHVLFESIDSDLQKTFVEDWNEYYKDNIENEENLENSKVIHPVIRKRYEDKFNYFAIRFLDEYAGFPTLRFQVNVGNYLHHKTKKQIAGTQITSDREIKEKITLFCRLSEINNAKADFFRQQEEKKLTTGKTEETEDDANTQEYCPESEMWEMFPNPSYDFPKENTGEGKPQNAGKIGIRLKLNDVELEAKISEAKNKLNTAKRKSNKPSKSDIINQIIEKADIPVIYQGQPTAYLSMNDIHSLLFELLVTKKAGVDLEKILVDKIERQINSIIQKDTSIPILKKYKNAESGVPVNLRKLENDLKLEIEETQRLIKEHKQRENDVTQSKKNTEYKPQRKYVLTNSEKGKVAVWIANDLKRFMPQEFKKNWKGYQHSELQRDLAFYEIQRNQLAALLHGWDIKKNNPFIVDFGIQKFETFYKEYLANKLQYVKGLRSRFENFKNESKVLKNVLKECFTFLKEQNYIVATLDAQIQHILAMPVFIERGLFDDRPTIIKGKSFSENKDLFADWYAYYKDYTEYQNFYDRGSYPLAIKDAKKLRKIKSRIKQQQRNDVFALLMAKHIFKDLFNEELNVTLKEVFQTRKEREENQQKATHDKERNQNYIWNKTIDIELSVGKDRIGSIKIKNVKLKDVGDFRKYGTDARVEMMIRYEPQREWVAYLPNDRNEHFLRNTVIQEQIDVYEKIRSEHLLKEVQEVEKHIYEKVEVSNREGLKHNGHENFGNYIRNGLLKHIRGMDLDNLPQDVKQKERFLIRIRNKFAHNELPEKWFFDQCKELYAIEEQEHYAEYYLRVFKNCAKELLDIKKAEE